LILRSPGVTILFHIIFRRWPPLSPSPGREMKVTACCIAITIASAGLCAAGDSKQARVLFDREVAGILARRCLECHDTAASEGEIDLSRGAAALQSGAIQPGDAEGSRLWKAVAGGEMPPDGDPLPQAEQQVLRRWIEAGADYTVDWIDPALYGHGSNSQGTWVRRLTVPEYVETVRATLGVDISAEAERLLPADLRTDGFSNTAYNLGVDLKHIEAYANLADLAVAKADIAAFARRFNKKRLMIDKVMRPLIADMGLVVLRGPLKDWEGDQYRGLTTTVASVGGDFDDAVTVVLEAMLQSPRFVYRIEQQPTPGKTRQLNDFEIASRLSYLIWGGPPDEQLLKAAEKGELQKRDRTEAEARRMLDDPRAVRQSQRFLSEWLNLKRLNNLRPGEERFPSWDPELAQDMRAETLAFIDEVLWEENRPVSELFNAQFTYATPSLAEHYGLTPKGNANELQRYDLADTPGRGGLLTQGSVLTIGGDEASMVTRGLFVLHDLLRGIVKDPPPCVDTTPVPTEPGLSNRSIAEARIQNEACGGCHKRFEPLAFGLEPFDGLGRYRSRDAHGNELRQDGRVLFPGDRDATSFDSTEELMNLLAESDRVKETFTWKFTQFALGRMPGGEEAPLVREIHRKAWEAGGTYQDLVLALATSDLILELRSGSE